MVTIKGWERERHSTIIGEVDFWRNKQHKARFVSISKIQKGSPYWEINPRLKYDVFISGKEEIFAIQKETLVSARKYAQDFMKKHPKG